MARKLDAGAIRARGRAGNSSGNGRGRIVGKIHSSNNGLSGAPKILDLAAHCLREQGRTDQDQSRVHEL